MQTNFLTQISVFWQEMGNLELLGNSLQNLTFALLTFLALRLLLRRGHRLVMRKLEAIEEEKVNEKMVEIFASIPGKFWTLASFFVGLKFLTIPTTWESVITILFWFLVVFRVILIAQQLISEILRKNLAGPKNQNQTAVEGLNIIVKILLWSGGLMLLISNFGIDISALVASFGVAGIAVAFALQNVLSDIFSSFSIYFDKPFQIGDFIVIGGDAGVVKKIGLKSTRIQTLQGEEMVLSNQELTSTRIQNFKKMHKRRVVLRFGVIYDTPTAKMRKIPQIVQKIVEKEELAVFDRSHFCEFADSSLNFETIYYVKTGDYEKFMDIQQSINLGAKEAFEKEKIEMAYPTQTLFLQK